MDDPKAQVPGQPVPNGDTDGGSTPPSPQPDQPEEPVGGEELPPPPPVIEEPPVTGQGDSTGGQPAA